MKSRRLTSIRLLGLDLKFLMLTLMFFVFFIGLGELGARSNVFQLYLAEPNWGGRHDQLNRQLRKLHDVSYRQGRIDCIFLGNSMVMRGFDPLAFHNAYLAQTGEELWCFNFGVDALPTSAAGELAEILVEDFHPHLLVYGLDARDLAVPLEAEDTKVVTEMEWLRYRQGDFSPKGWLREHSYFYRDVETFRRLMRFDYQLKPRVVSGVALADRYGFYGDPIIWENVGEPPDVNDARHHIQYYYNILSDYKILSENISGLQKILDYQRQGIRLIFVEMPTPITYLDFFRNGEEDYARYLALLNASAEEFGVPIVQVPSYDLIPNDHWADYSHLSIHGARVYSQWLGEALADLLSEDEISKWR